MAMSALSEEHWQEDKSLVECNKYMLDQGLGDVTFKIRYKGAGEGEEKEVYVKALKTLLLARSPVFCRMFSGQLADKTERPHIDIDDVEPEAFKQMLRFIYTDEVEITHHNVMAIMYSAKKYMVTKLTKKCVTFVQEHMCTKTAPELLNQSILLGEKELKDKVLAKIENEASEVLASEEFIRLSKDALREVLQLEMKIQKELEVFEATMRWAERKCQELKKVIDGPSKREVLGESLYQIRFPTMSVADFNDHVVPKDVLSESEGFKVFRYFTAASDKKPTDLPFPSNARPKPSDVDENTVNDTQEARVTGTSDQAASASSPSAEGTALPPHEEAVPALALLHQAEASTTSSATPRSNFLIFPPPYQVLTTSTSTSAKHASTACTSLKCYVARPFRISKIFVHAISSDVLNFSCSLSVSLTQNGKSLFQYKGIGGYIPAEGDTPANYIVDVSDDITVHAGLFELAINKTIYTSYAIVYGQTGVNAVSNVTSSSVCKLSDNDLTITFHPVSGNLLLGIEYSLV